MTRPFAYIGWSGRGNLGDDAIQDALEGAQPGSEFLPVPLEPRDLLRLRPRQLARLRRATPLLGGGTAIGRKNWRVHVHTALALARGRPALMIGAGVEDPGFVGRHSFSGAGELEKWPGVLDHFARVTVRGPRSAELLADVGVAATVVGDPALLFHRVPRRQPEPQLLAVNLGFGDDLWGHDHDSVVETVALLVKRLATEDWRFRFLVVNPSDLVHAHR